MPADRIRQHRALTDEKLPTAMQHQARLLLFRFCWHEPHRRSRYRLTDRSSIIRVILAALEVSLHIVRWHQPHRMAERLKLAAPMMCGRTRLNTNKAWRQGSEKLRHLSAAYPPADHHCAINIHAVDLKDRLRNIETNCANFAHGRLPSSWFASTQPPYGTLMPQSGRRPQHHSRRSRAGSHVHPFPLCPKNDRIAASPRIDAKCQTPTHPQCLGEVPRGRRIGL